MVSECQIKNRFLEMPAVQKLPPSREWLYFLEGHFDRPLIKIGHSRSLKQRLVMLQANIPVQLKLIAAVNAPAGSEFVLHRIFEGERAYNEWFTPSAELLSFARELPKGGKINGELLLNLGGARSMDLKQLRLLFWNGTRRVESGMKVQDESLRKRPLERVVLDGFNY